MKCEFYESRYNENQKIAREMKEMELIKVKRHFQLTIPVALREKLRLAVGDYVQADVENGKIVIRPVEVVSPEKEKSAATAEAKQKAWAMLDEIWTEMKDQDPLEVEELVDEAVKAVRKNQ